MNCFQRSIGNVFCRVFPKLGRVIQYDCPLLDMVLGHLASGTIEEPKGFSALPRFDTRVYQI